MVLITFLLFHFFVRNSTQEKHSLHYRFVALTKTDLFPEFRAVGLFDDMEITHYSNDRDTWVRDNLTVEWRQAPAGPPGSRTWFLGYLYDLSQCKHVKCSEIHVLQRITGCDVDKFSNGTKKTYAYDKYAFDGNRFIAFDYDTKQWVEKSPDAKETKKKWDRETGRNEQLKSFLEGCIHWVSTFNKTKKNSPDVRVFARKAPDDQSKLDLICLVTGFYPRDIEVNIRLNRNNLQNQTSSGVRPNDGETFQMRTSVKIDRNYRGSYDCFVVHSSLREAQSVEWDGKCVKCEAESQMSVIAGVSFVSSVFVFSLVIVYYIYKRRSNSQVNGNARYGAVTHSYQLSSLVQRRRQ